MARARSIGSMYAELSVKDNMTVGIRRAQKALQDFTSKVGTIGAGIAAAVPAAVFTGLVASMKSAVDEGGRLSDMMARTGADGEKLFVMQRAFENAGIAADAVPAALNRMQKSLAGNNDGFEKLGLNVAKLKGMDVAEAFRLTAESIAKVEDPAQRTALAMQIFGKSGGELLAVMNDPSAFEAAARQVGSLGKTLSENAAAFDKISDSLGLFKTKSLQVGATLAAELAPQLEKMADGINELDLSSVTKDAIDFAKALSDIASKALEVSKNLPGFNTAADVYGLVEKGIGFAASFGPEQGQALAPQGYIGKNGKAVDMSIYNDGLMVRDIKNFTDKIPDLLKKRPDFSNAESFDQLNPGGTILDNLKDVLEYAGTITTTAERPADSFKSTQYDVNEMQRRGLGYGGETMAREANKQVTLLKQIYDVLRKASTDGKLVWD